MNRGGLTGGEVMTQLLCSQLNSLSWLNLSHKAYWWKSNDDAFPQLLTFLGSQMSLEEFWLFESDLTTSQTAQLLKCIAQ